MRGLIRGFLIVVCGAVLYRGMSLSINILQQFCSVKSSLLCADVRLSSQARQLVSVALAQDPLFKLQPNMQQAEHLKRLFPWIADCSFLLNQSGVLSVKIHAAQPLCMLNNQFVVIDSGSINDVALFTEQVTSVLPKLTVSEDLLVHAQIDSFCKDYIVKAPWHLMVDYACLWHSPTNIMLQRVDQPLFSIMCSNEHIPTQELLQECLQALSNLDAQGQLKKASSKKWVADVRFDKQIVVYALRRGG